MDITQIITILTEMQEKLLEKTTSIEKRLNIIENTVNDIKNNRKPRKYLRVKEQTRERYKTIDMVDIVDILSVEPSLEHIDIVLFSSLEFAFCIVFIENLCDLYRISKECTRFVYEELEFCDNHYQLDIKTQLTRVKSWFHDNGQGKSIFPFKLRGTIDNDALKKSDPNDSLLGYYNKQWCSSSYKPKLMALYESFCIKIIHRFCEWQDIYKREIEINTLPKKLDYSECVVKVMGCPNDFNSTTKSIELICDYLGEMCQSVI